MAAMGRGEDAREDATSCSSREESEEVTDAVGKVSAHDDDEDIWRRNAGRRP